RHTPRSPLPFSPVSAPSATFSVFSLTASPPTDIYSLSLHDALPISRRPRACRRVRSDRPRPGAWIPTSISSRRPAARSSCSPRRSEEHTSELQSRENLVCRLLLEKKNETGINTPTLTVEEELARHTG